MTANKVIGISMVRDEADVVISMLRQLENEGLDALIVADNNSVDGTRDLLSDFARTCSIPVIVKDDPEVGYEQAKKMSRLAHEAAEIGAAWVVPADSDEAWHNQGDRVGHYLRTMSNSVWAVAAPLYNHFRTALDLDDSDPFRSIVYRQPEPVGLPKVACRVDPGLEIQMGNHGALYNGQNRTVTSTLQVRHFPYRSFSQMVRKSVQGAQAYAATDMPYQYGQHWRDHAKLIEREGEDKFRREVWERHYFSFSPVDKGWVYDPAPYMRWS